MASILNKWTFDEVHVRLWRLSCTNINIEIETVIVKNTMKENKHYKIEEQDD